MDDQLSTEVNSQKLAAIQQLSSKQFMTLQRVERLSELMDSRYGIPRTKIRFGLDAILGIFPVVGDAISLCISSIMIYAMYKHGASKEVITKMSFNATLDAVIGGVPGAGVLFDAYYKANQRNLVIFQDYFFSKHEKSFDEPFDKTKLYFCVGVFLCMIYMVLYLYFDLGATL